MLRKQILRIYSFLENNYKILLVVILYSGSMNAQELMKKKTEKQEYKLSWNSPGELKQIDAGDLNIGYIEAGPANGTAVLLLHGWPYDIHSFEQVVPILVAKGYRVLVPFLRGFGSTKFLSEETIRNGQQCVFAVDMIAFMDALKIKKAIIGGFDWGARTALIMGALWPDRCKGIVAVSGYIIINVEKNQQPLPPAAEYGWWYQYYFSTDRGKEGYSKNTDEFDKLIWKLASPKWNFDDETYHNTSIAFNNPDHVEIVIHNYRWRLGLAKGERRFDSIESKLAQRPVISVAAITIGSDFDGDAANGLTYTDRFIGKYSHLILKGIGHNVPQEAPEFFAEAIIKVNHFSE